MRTIVSLLLIFIFSSFTRKKDVPDCIDLHTGIFEIAVNRNVITIKRTEREQTDFIGEHYMRYRMHWTDDCTCKLELTDTDIPEVRPLIGSEYTIMVTEKLGKRFRIVTTAPDRTTSEGFIRKYNHPERLKQ